MFRTLNKYLSIISITLLICFSSQFVFAVDFLSGYTKRIKLTVDSSKVDATLTNFPVMVNLDSAGSYSYSESMANGHDIRFTDSTGTVELSFEREVHDATTTTGIYWVKLDSVSSTAGTDFYMYYSTAETTDGSDRESVWDSDYRAVYHMNDWTKGIDCNGKTRPFYPALNAPAAYYYNGNTYVTWRSSSGNGDPAVNVYDHTLKSWSVSVTAGTSPTTDEHNVPVVIVDNSGYIHIAHPRYGNVIHYEKSTNPEDITLWTTMTSVGSTSAYPRWAKDDGGDLYLWWRYNERYQSYIMSTDGGATWTARHSVIDTDASNRCYGTNVEYDATNDRMCMGWIVADAADTLRLNLYYAYMDVSNSTMYSVTGTDLGTMISTAEADANCLIDNTGTYQVRSPVLRLDSSGNPYIIYVKDSAGGLGQYFIYHNGSTWSSPEEIKSTNNAFDACDFYVTSTQDITSYLSDYTDIFEYAWNGTTWSETRTLTTPVRNQLMSGFNYPKVVMNGTDDLRVVFCAVDATQVFDTVPIFAADSDGNLLPNDNVRASPFVMDSTSNDNDGWRRSYSTNSPASVDAVVYKGLDYNGSTEYTKILNHTSLDLTGTTEFFIEAMVNVDGDATDYAFIGKWLLSYLLKFESTGDYLTVAAYDSGSQTSITGNDSIDPDTWYYIIGRRSGNSLNGYVNNVVGTTDTLGTVTTAGEDLYLGSLVDQSQKLNGTLDEIRISGTDRGTAYGVATKAAIDNTLLTYGAEETPEATGRYLLLFRGGRYVLPLKD